MPTIVDTLITRYTLDAKGYDDGAKKVLASSQGLASKIGAFAGTASALSLTGMVAFAVNSAVSFDTLTRSLTAVTKSGDRAAQVLGFVDKLAIPSVFDSEGLAQAATTLEAFGLKTERWLPVVEKLGTVFGGTTGDLMQFVNAIGMIKAGRAGEGLEALGRAGVSRDALGARGIKFDKGGSLKSSVGDLMNAVESEVNDRFGNLGEVMGGGAAAKFASFTDALKRSMRDVGNAILTFALPYVIRLSDWLQEMTQSGKMKEFGEKLVSVFTSLGNTLGVVWNILSKIPAPILVAGAAFLALHSPITSVLTVVASVAPKITEYFKTAFLGAGGWAKIGMTLISGALLAGVAFLISYLNDMADKIWRFSEAKNALSNKERYYTDDAGHFIDPKTGKRSRSPIERPSSELWPLIRDKDKQIRKDDAKAAAQEAMDEFSDGMGAGQPAAIQQQQLNVLKKIEANTDRQNELAKYIFGGGALGRIGVPITEMNQNPARVMRQLRSMGVQNA